MTTDDRFAAVLNRLSSATSSLRVRAYDEARSERNGDQQASQLERVVTRLEGMADELELALK